MIRMLLTYFLIIQLFCIFISSVIIADDFTDEVIDSIILYKQTELLKKYRTKQAVPGILWPQTLGKLLNFGDDALDLEMYEIAGEAYKRAGVEANKTDDKPSEAYITGQRALCMQGLNKDGLAIEYFRTSASSYHSIGDLAGESKQLCGMAVSHQKRKQVITAEKLLKQAFNLSGQAEDRDGALKASYQLGELHLSKKEIQLALDQYKIALTLSRVPLNTAMMALVFAKISICYSKLYDIPKAEAYRDSVNRIIDNNDWLEQVK